MYNNEKMCYKAARAHIKEKVNSKNKFLIIKVNSENKCDL